MFPKDFDPFDFFEGRTAGAGVILGPFGRVIRRCTIVTDGQPNSEFAALHFDETYAYDDGSPDDVMHWAVTRASGAFEAAEPSVVGRVSARLDGPRWRVDFRRHLRPPNSGPVVLYRADFTQVSHDLVLKSVAISLLGVTVARLQGFHRQI